MISIPDVIGAARGEIRVMSVVVLWYYVYTGGGGGGGGGEQMARGVFSFNYYNIMQLFIG